MDKISYTIKFRTEEQRDEFAAMVAFLADEYDDDPAVVSDIVYSSKPFKKYRENSETLKKYLKTGESKK